MGILPSAFMFPDQHILRVSLRKQNRKNTSCMIFINNIINQILVPGNQGSFQIFMLAPLPILHRIPLSIRSQTLQMLL
ncbi:Autophagy-related 21 [Gossypium arboreum]|uniref:Autophagy-related 21 n=1 Tax=Gossypium arboreum TaxID=29729 RepID=A0A0B0PWD8_GOSAR|nr:Autophagy-related 21 [Gossypium arboreum]